MKTKTDVIEIIRDICKERQVINLKVRDYVACWKNENGALSNTAWKAIGYVSALAYAYSIESVGEEEEFCLNKSTDNIAKLEAGGRVYTPTQVKKMLDEIKRKLRAGGTRSFPNWSYVEIVDILDETSGLYSDETEKVFCGECKKEITAERHSVGYDEPPFFCSEKCYRKGCTK